MSNCHKFSSLFDDKDVIANVLCMFKIMILQYLPLYTYNIIRYNTYKTKLFGFKPGFELEEKALLQSVFHIFSIV